MGDVKNKLAEKIADEFINEMMMSGIALLLMLSGVNYFGMEWSWLEGVKSSVGGVSNTAATAELAQMMTALTHTFPYNYIFVEYNFWTTVIIAICLTVLGLFLKALIVRTKGKFIIELGKELYVPAIIGFCGIIGLQVWNAVRVTNYLEAKNMLAPNIPTGIFVWNSYGQLFTIGAALLIIGAIVKIVAEKNGKRKLLIVGDAMFDGSFILIIYYIIIRLISLDLIMNSGVGNILNVFIISNKYSNVTIAICVFVFTFGKALRKYGIAVLKHEKKMHELDAFRLKHELMKQQYGARPITQQPAHPKQILVHDHYLHGKEPVRPLNYVKSHPVHRYSQMGGKYNK